MKPLLLHTLVNYDDNGNPITVVNTSELNDEKNLSKKEIEKRKKDAEKKIKEEEKKKKKEEDRIKKEELKLKKE